MTPSTQRGNGKAFCENENFTATTGYIFETPIYFRGSCLGFDRIDDVLLVGLRCRRNQPAGPRLRSFQCPFGVCVQDYLWRRIPLPSLYMGQAWIPGTERGMLAQRQLAQHCQRRVLRFRSAPLHLQT